MANGLSLSTTSNLSTGQKIVVANANMALEPAAPDVDLVLSDPMPAGHKQRDVLTYARFADASALTEGVDLSQTQQIVTASLSLTPTEHGIIAAPSKRLIMRQGDNNIEAAVGRMLGGSVGRRRGKDIVALYDSLNKSVSGASTTLDITVFRGSVAYLLTDNDSGYGPAPMPLDAVLHIEQISDIILDVSDPGTAAGVREGFSADMMQRWWRGRDRLYSAGIFHSGIIERDGSSDAKGAIKNSEAHVYVPAVGTDEVTREVDNSLRVIEFGVFAVWAEGERADPWGVEVYSDATATV